MFLNDEVRISSVDQRSVICPPSRYVMWNICSRPFILGLFVIIPAPCSRRVRSVLPTCTGVSRFQMLPISVFTRSQMLVSLYITSLLPIVSFCLQTLLAVFLPVDYRYFLSHICKRVTFDRLSRISSASLACFKYSCLCTVMYIFLFLSFT